jgi:hypothetical protein
VRALTTGFGLVALSAAARGQAVETFGTSVLTYAAVGANAFVPANNTITYLNGISLSQTQDGLFTSSPVLPSGALIVSVQWHFCSDGASFAPGHSVNLLSHDAVILHGQSSNAEPIGPGCTTVTQDVSGLNLVVDNQRNRLELDVLPIFAADSFTAAVVAYKLQVSPAPPTATFGDVPTSHPFYQFIEALAASGITGGCGEGNYCPDQPLTRGQMAVFLAKALGLEWP